MIDPNLHVIAVACILLTVNVTRPEINIMLIKGKWNLLVEWIQKLLAGRRKAKKPQSEEQGDEFGAGVFPEDE